MGQRFAKTTIPHYERIDTVIYDMICRGSFILFKTTLDKPLVLFYHSKHYNHICNQIQLYQSYRFEIDTCDEFHIIHRLIS